MADYFRFILRALLWAVALMSGILSVLREAMAIFLPNQVPQRSLFGNCVIIAFIISAIILWVIEHKKVINISAKLARETEHNRPKFSSQIDLVILSSAEKNESSIIIITAIIKNTGAPSIATNFQMSVIIKDTETVGKVFLIPEKIVVNSNDGGQLVLKSEDNLIWKSIQQPIITGGAVSGFYSALIPNVRQEDIVSGSIIIFRFEDIYGNICTVQHVYDRNQTMKLLDLNKLQNND